MMSFEHSLVKQHRAYCQLAKDFLTHPKSRRRRPACCCHQCQVHLIVESLLGALETAWQHCRLLITRVIVFNPSRKANLASL